MQFETAMSKSTIIITVLYWWSVPTHPLAHPGDVYQRQLAREEVSRGGCAVPGASPSRRHLWLFRAWGVKRNKSRVCLLASWKQRWEKLLLTNASQLVEPSFFKQTSCWTEGYLRIYPMPGALCLGLAPPGVLVWDRLCSCDGCCNMHLLTNDVQTFQRATV